MTITTAAADDARAHLVDTLTDAGVLVTPAWREAFAAVPRHRFAPAVYCVEPDTGRTGSILRADQPDHTDAYLAAVYSDDAIVTQISDTGIPTSSSTQPGVMATMLEALQVDDGMTVLEIGTGTGYNAALLSARLGDTHVASIDIDPALVDAARDALAAIGYRPQLAAADGLAGYPPMAPYDRIIATCSVRRVPPTWLAQTRAGGIVMANLSYGVIPLRVGSDGSATGRFLPQVAAFIEARPADGPRVLNVDQILNTCLGRQPEATGTAGAEFDALDNEAFEFVWRLLAPGVNRCGLLPPDETIHCLADADAGSWARAHRHTDGRTEVAQGGTRRLWDDLAAAWRRWHTAGSPDHSQLGLTITPNGRHILRQHTGTGHDAEWVID